MLDVVWFTLKPHNEFGQTYKQASKKTDFTVDLIWWGSPHHAAGKFGGGVFSKWR